MRTTRRRFLKMVAGAALVPVIPGFAKAQKPKSGSSAKPVWDDPGSYKTWHSHVPEVIYVHGGIGIPPKRARCYTRSIEKAIQMALPGSTIYVLAGVYVTDGPLLVPPGKDGLTITGDQSEGPHRIHLNGPILLQSNRVMMSHLRFKCTGYLEGEGIIDLTHSEWAEGCLVTRCWFDGSPHREVERVGIGVHQDLHTLPSWFKAPEPIEADDLRAGDIFRLREANGTVVGVGTVDEFRVALEDGSPWNTDRRYPHSYLHLFKELR
jgi:hypothetical protein